MTRRLHDAWVKWWDPRPSAGLRLVCFPHAGGSAVFYRNWARSFPLSVEVASIEYPGRMNRISEPLIDSAGEMADEIARVVLRHVEPPFALMGHSMGAMVAFETARRLERLPGPGPVRLFISGRKGPRDHRPGRRHLAPDDDLFAYLRVLGGTDDGVYDQPALRQVLLPILRNDFKLSETWNPVPDATVSCPITTFVGDDDPEVTVEQAAGWLDATRGAFQLRVFPGHHFYLLEHEQAVIDDVYDQCCDHLEDHRSARLPTAEPAGAAGRWTGP